jgi:outer membrane murein-binding lipoprotein Lpp
MNGRTQPHLPSGVRTVLLILGTTLMAGCAAPQQPAVVTSSAPPVTQAPAPVAESFAKYEALRAEMTAALEAKMPDISWTVDKPATLATAKDGRCLLSPQTMKSSADVVEPSNHFADIFAAGDPVLARHGFPAFGGTDAVPGGWVVARSTDAAGATLTIESKSPAYLRISVPVDSATCKPDEIPQK